MIQFLADNGLSPVAFLLLGIVLFLVALRMWTTRGQSRSAIVLAALAFVAAAAPSVVGIPVALTNAALLKLPASTLVPMPIARMGVNTIGDAPVSWWWRQNGTCSIADVGSCNNASDGNSFVSTNTDVRQWGLSGDGTTDNTAGFARLFANTASINFQFPEGIYRIACPSNVPRQWTSASGISFWGAGKGGSVIKFDAGCLWPTAFAAPGNGSMNFTNHHSEIHDITIDLNIPTAQTAVTSPIQFNATGANTIAGPVFDNSEIINGTSPMVLLSINAYSGGVVNGGSINNSRFTLATADTKQNECINTYTWANNGTPGTINGGSITNNICINTAMSLDGNNVVVTGNDISGFEFGSGIFTNFSSITLSCSATVISNNTIHDSPPTFDVNNVAPTGIESSCPNTIISGNSTHNLGGSGISSIGDNSVLSGNQVFANGASTIIAAAGSGYGSSITAGHLTWAGAGCSVNPVLQVNSNSSGAISAITNVLTAGVCTTFPPATAATWTASSGLSAGTGVKVRLLGVVNGGAGGYNTVAALGSNGTCPLADCTAAHSGISMYGSAGCTSNPAVAPIQACNRNSSVIGNVSGDGGAGTQLYGITLNSSISINTIFRSNVFSGLTGGASINNSSPLFSVIEADTTYYNEVIASTGAITSFQWVGLDTASFKSWTLKCSNLNPTTAQVIYIELGEGAGPTWKTGSYVAAYNKTTTAGGGASAPWIAASLTGIPITAFGESIANSPGVPAGFVADLGDLAWPAGLNAYKPILISNSTYTNNADASANTLTGFGVWEGDNGSFTAVRVISPDTLTGQCTLTGKP